MKGSVELAWEVNGELANRLRSWLEAAGARSRLTLGRGDVQRILKAVEAQRELYHELEREAAALVALNEGDPYDEQAVLATYLGILDGSVTSVSRPLATYRHIAARGRDSGVTLVFRGTPTTEKAVKATMHAHGFPSRAACVKYIFRARQNVKRDRTGWRGAINPRFQLPSNR